MLPLPSFLSLLFFLRRFFFSHEKKKRQNIKSYDSIRLISVS